MKLKAPKTWQMVMIFVSIVLLAVGGGILYVYLTGGFDEDVTYPESIDVLDSDSVYESTTMQYEAVEDFELTFSTSTEGVNRRGITLSFPSGIAVTRDPEKGTISDGVIVVPENLVLDQAFTVSLVQQAYDSTTLELVENVEEHEGEVTYINKGGISQLVITPENSTDFNRQITIAVDVPALGLDIKFVDDTTGYEYDDSEGFVIPEGTNFTAVPVFKPEASAYQYSDNLNSAIANKREKSVFYSLGASADGITLNYTDSGVYFTAHEEVSSGNVVNAFAFANAREEKEFAQDNPSLQGQAYYNQAINTLSESDSAVTGNASVSVIEANVGLFSVAQNTEANPYELSVDKLFTIKAGNDASEGAALSAVIQDIHGADLSGMIRGIGARIISATNSNGGDISTSVELRGGRKQNATNEQTYTMINSSVRDLAESYFELSSSAEGSIQIGVVLLVQDEEGRYNVFGEEKVFYATVTTHVEDLVWWDTRNWADSGGITMKIIYDGGEAVATEYPHDLSDFAVVPEGNVYQTKMFFVYGTDADTVISVASLGAGNYQIGGSGTQLYPLSGSQLVALSNGEVDLIFATVRTDAYGNPEMTEGDLYQLVQVSSPVRVTVENSLRGINSVEVEVDTEQNWSVGSGANMYLAIPTGTNITGGEIGTQITMQIHLEEGDGEIFMDEYQDRVSIFASTGPNGAGETFTDIFLTKLVEFTGDISTEEDIITVYLGINPNLQIPDIMGKSYYINVSYDNSISPDITTADVYNLTDSGRVSVRQSITVYNQTTQRLNSALAGGTYNATQTLETDGESATSITGGTADNPDQYAEDTIDSFNNALQPFNSGTNVGIRTYDAYGRVFDGAYTVESNNYEAVRVTQVGGEYELSFGNVQNGSARITITSGAVSASFTMNVTSQGVSAIYVLGTRYENTTAVSYTYTPSAEGIAADSAEIKLKNGTDPGTGAFPADTALQNIGNGILLVTVKETDGGELTQANIFSPREYDIAFDSTFLSTVSSDFWDMISYKTTDDATWRTGVAPTAGASIYSIRVNQHFGEDVTIRFNARNDAGTLNFNFDLTIKATATLVSNTLSQVDYGSSIGVEGHTVSDTIGVYAGFGINLNDSDGSPTNYLSVENVNWGAVFGGDREGVTAATYYIRPDDSGVLRIYTSQEASSDIATIQNGVLTFADVSVATTYNLTLYAVTKIDAGQVVGNSYGYWTDLSFTVYPNLQIKYASETNGTISLEAIATYPSSYSYSRIFFIDRITKLVINPDSGVGTLPLPPYYSGDYAPPDTLTAGGIITRYSFVDPTNGLEYIQVSTEASGRGSITRTDGTTLTFTRGEPKKQITLHAYNSDGDQILSKNFTLTLGINVSSLAEDTSTPPLIYTTSEGAPTNAISAITFNGMTSALITNRSVYVNKSWSTTGGMTATLNQINMGQGRFCTLTSTEDDDRYTLSFNPRQAIYAEDDAYLSFTFKSSDDSDGTEYATWQIPIVYSQIGSDFVGNETDSGYDLYKIIHNGLTIDLAAGDSYDLYNKAGLGESSSFTGADLSVSFDYLVDGEVADYSNSVISSLSGGMLMLKNLSSNYAGLTDGVLPIDIRITILNSANSVSQSFVLHINVQPNATLDAVNYPYSGSAEFVTVASGGDYEINLDEDNRFPDTTTPSLGESPEVPLGNGTYSIVQLLIGGEPAENIQSYVSLSGSTLTLHNPNGALTNATLTIRKSYENFFGEALDYVFSINSVAVDYALNVEKDSTNAYADEVKPENGRVTINLARTTSGASHIFSVTTTQTDSANNTSNAPTSVTTVLSQAKPGETTATSTEDNITIEIGGANYTFALADTSDTQPTNPKTLTITTPTFVATDTLITLTFVINRGEQTIDVDVLIPATANLEWITDDTLQGGSVYTFDAFNETSNPEGLFGTDLPAGVNITNVIAYVPGNYDVASEVSGARQDPIDESTYYIPANFLTTTADKLTIEPIYKNTLTATIRVYYKYNTDYTGYTEKTFNFKPNLMSNNQAISDIVAGTTRQKAIDNGTTDDPDGFGILVPDGTSVLKRSGAYSLTRTNVASSLFDEGDLAIVNCSGGSVCLKIAPDYVSQNTPTVIRFTLTYENGSYSFTTDVIEMTFTIVAAATLSVNYPQPFGTSPSAYANEQDLGYEVQPINLLNGDGASGIDLAEFFATDGTETGTAALTSEKRFEYKNTDPTTDDTPATPTDGTVTYSVRSFSGITANTSGETYEITTCTDCTSCPEDCGDDCTCQIFKLAEGARASEGASVTFGITYKGVIAEYVVYFFTSPITAQTRSTIHQVVTSDGAYEEIYADQTGIYVGESYTGTTGSDSSPGSIEIGDTTYSVVYKEDQNPELTLVPNADGSANITNSDSTITVGDRTYTFSHSDGVLTLTRCALAYASGAEATTITVAGTTYNFAVSDSTLTSFTNESGENAGTIVGTQLVLGRTIYNYTYSGNILTLTEVQVFNGTAQTEPESTGTITIAGTTYTYTYNEEGVMTDLSYTTPSAEEGGESVTTSLSDQINGSTVTINGVIYDYTISSGNLTLSKQGYVVTSTGSNITVGGATYTFTYVADNTLVLSLSEKAVYSGTNNRIKLGNGNYYYTVSETGTLTLTPTTNIFAKNRLVELGIDASAPAGQLQQIWIRPVDAAQQARENYELLTSFLLTGSLISAGNNIFVDIGLIDEGSYVGADNLLKSGYEFVIGFFNSNGNFIETSYLTFIRQASRVEYFYTLSNGGTQLITHTDLKIVEEEGTLTTGTNPVWTAATGETTRFENGEIATFRVQYKIGSGEASGAVYLQAKKELDITVDNAWTSSNHTVLEMQTNYLNHYTLVDMAGIRHPSTGELLSADNIGDATINVEVVNPKSDATEFARIIGTGEEIPAIDQFVYQTTGAEKHDYLTFTQITVSQTDTRVYDFYLFGEGADNDGSYVLLRFTYRAEGGAEEEYYLVVRLIPDYDVRIGGVQVAEAGVTTDGAASNETLPYDFVPSATNSGNAPMNIATASDSIVSFVRRNWDSSNIARSLTYELDVQADGNGYNAASNIQKLNLNTTSASEPKWTLTSSADGDVYTWSNPTAPEGLVLKPNPIAFGTKTYMLTISNAWGFKIEFFFTLSPPTAQNPVISTANTDATYREGETFDVGVIYDLVTVTQNTPTAEEAEAGATTTYDITVARDQLPDDNSGQTKMIVVDNIATWGVSSSSYKEVISNANTSITTGQSLYGQYLYNVPEGETENIVTDSMLYQYVTIESVSFKFGDEEAQPATVNTGEGIRTNSKLLTSGDLNAYNGWKDSHGIAFNSVQDTSYGALFTVPNLPGWYYGTSNSIQVEVHVTLKYENNGDEETCDISFPATISRQYSITSKKHVVTDAEEFTLKDYILVRDTQGNSDVADRQVTYYDDTLEITLPQNGGAATIRVDVTRVTRDGTTTFTGTRTVTNTYQERQQTVYESMSDIVGTTLQPNTDTVVITVTPNDISSGHEDFRVRYANDDITDDVPEYTFASSGDSEEDGDTPTTRTTTSLSSTDIFALNFGTGSTSAFATVVMQLTRGSGEEAQLFTNSRTFEVAANESTPRYAYVGTVDEFFNGVQGFDEFKDGDKVKVYFTGSNLASLYFGTSEATTKATKAQEIATPSNGATEVETYKSYAVYSTNSAEESVPKWTAMSNDTLYIENSARFRDDYGVIDKTYIVGIDTDETNGADYYYRHDQTFYLARAYYSLDTGLGETTIKQIDVSDYFVEESGSTQIQVKPTPDGEFGNITAGNAGTGSAGNYKIPIGIWGENVNLYTATDGKNGNVAASSSSTGLAGMFGDAYDITYTYTAGETPSVSFTASGDGAPTFSEVTVDSTTGQGSFKMTVGDVTRRVTRTYSFTINTENGNITSINGIDIAAKNQSSSYNFNSATFELFGAVRNYEIEYNYTEGKPTFETTDIEVRITVDGDKFIVNDNGVERTYSFTISADGKTLTSVNGHAVEVKSGESFSSILLTSPVYFEVSDASDSYSRAYFDGTYLYTGDDYEINRQNYILINIYVKASGGPNETFERNSRDHLLGSYRIILV